jgi:hypothetical protein
MCIKLLAVDTGTPYRYAISDGKIGLPEACIALPLAKEMQRLPIPL